MTSHTVSIEKLLEGAKHYDPDERFMALSDLTNLLSRVDGILESSMQVSIRNTLLRVLVDKSIDVQAMAVKCLSVCVQKFHSDQVGEIVERLGKLVIDPDKAESRDIYTIGLKTLIGSVRDEDTESVCPKIVRYLVRGLQQQRHDTALGLVCLDILRELAHQFGSDMVDQHEELLKVMFPLLEGGEERMRKRASLTIGAMVRDLSDAQFAALMDRVITIIENETTLPEVLYTDIQTVGIISRHAGVRVGRYLDKIMPKLEQFCNLEHQADSEERRVELWENCLQAYEAVITRCPAEVAPYLDGVLSECLEFIKYDPNYSYDVDVEQDNGADDWGDEDDDDLHFEDAAEEDDDDESWKVRKAAVKAIDAFIRARNDILKEYYEALLEALLDRFKERDESVRLEIMRTVSDLLHASVTMSASSDEQHSTATVHVPVLVRQRSAFEHLQSRISTIVETCLQQLQASSSSVPTKLAVFGVLRELLVVCRGNLGAHLGQLMPVLVEEMRCKDVTLKTEVLALMYLVITFHAPGQLEPFVNAVAAAATQAMTDVYAKIKAEALRVVGTLVERVPSAASAPVAAELYDSTMAILVLKDMEQHVKEASISTMATLLAHHGNGPLKQHMADCLPIFVDRLSNEVTRLAALRAVARMSGYSPNGSRSGDGLHSATAASTGPVSMADSTDDNTLPSALFPAFPTSPVSSETPPSAFPMFQTAPLDLSPILEPSVQTLCKFLRQQSATLKHETIRTLDALVSSNGASIGRGTYESLLREVSSFIGDFDLFLSHIVLELISSCVKAEPSLGRAVVATEILPGVLQFVKSPLLQGAALQSVNDFFQALLLCDGFSYMSLLDSLLQCSESNQSKQSSAAIACCIAALSKRAGAEHVSSAVQRFLSCIRSADEPAHAKQLALLVLGEIGRDTDLNPIAQAIGADMRIEEVIFSMFDDALPNEVQLAASQALGNVVVGNVDKYLPLLLNLVEKQAEHHHYFLLNSLKEAVLVVNRLSRCGDDDGARRAAVEEHLDSAVTLLLRHADSPDEGVRSMAAECLGRLALIAPERIFDQFDAIIGAGGGTSSSSGSSSSCGSFARGVVINAVRFADPPKDKLASYLALLRDDDLNVRRQALVTATSLVHDHIDALDAGLIKQTILPVVYETTKLSIMRTVDYGPFKQKVDDGLPLRKASFQCLDTLLTVAPHRLDMLEFIQTIQGGLADSDDDVQVFTYQIFHRLAQHHGDALLEVLDDLPAAIMKSVKAQLKEAKKGTEGERAKDVLRAAVRALHAMNSIPNVDQCHKFTTFYLRVLKTAMLAQMLKEMDLES